MVNIQPTATTIWRSILHKFITSFERILIDLTTPVESYLARPGELREAVSGLGSRKEARREPSG
jgi:hypothetical protein